MVAILDLKEALEKQFKVLPKIDTNVLETNEKRGQQIREVAEILSRTTELCDKFSSNRRADQDDQRVP